MKKIYVTQSDDKKRIDLFLKQQCAQYTRGMIVRMIRADEVMLNNTHTKPHTIVHEGDCVAYNEKYTEKIDIIPQKEVEYDIVAENESFLIINKPRGLQVHPSAVRIEYTLVNGLLAYDIHIKNVGEDRLRPGIVHRLDKDTSGLMIIARTQESFSVFKKMFYEHAVHKTYHAIVHGHLRQKKGIINAPIARACSFKKQKIAIGAYKGIARDAITQYAVLEEYNVHNIPLSLVKVQPQTGRTHQIRIHMAHYEHPLLGDDRYIHKNERQNETFLKKECDVQTFFLHAKEISFACKNKKHHFVVPYPHYFEKMVQYMRTHNNK